MTAARQRFDPAEIARAKAGVLLSAVIGRRVALIKKGQNEWVGLCPFHSEKTPSFTVNDSKGFYHCFGCGAHGDHVEFMMAAEGLEFGDALKELGVEARRDDAVLPPPAQNVVRAAEEKAKSILRARQIVDAATPLARLDRTSLVRRYLEGRGIDIAAAPEAVRKVLRQGRQDYWDTSGDKPQSLGKYPVMVAPMVAPGPEGVGRVVVGAHLTYLQVLQDGRVVKARIERDGVALGAKKMRGQHKRSAIRFAAAGADLALAEGIENGLTLMQAGGWGFDPWAVPLWVAGSQDNLVGDGVGRGAAHPVDARKRLPSVEPRMDAPGVILPGSVRRVLLVEDSDNKDRAVGRALIERALNRWALEGRDQVVRITPPDNFDLNDLIRAA